MPVVNLDRLRNCSTLFLRRASLWRVPRRAQSSDSSFQSRNGSSGSGRALPRKTGLELARSTRCSFAANFSNACSLFVFRTMLTVPRLRTARVQRFMSLVLRSANSSECTDWTHSLSEVRAISRLYRRQSRREIAHLQRFWGCTRSYEICTPLLRSNFCISRKRMKFDAVRSYNINTCV